MRIKRKADVKLDNVKNIERLDKSSMLHLLTSFPKQCEDALFIGKESEIKDSYRSDYSQVLFTGLGGSAIGADIVRGYLASDMCVPVFVNRDYTLPRFANNNTLVFAVSYSGNTEETLSAYKDAKKIGARVVVITSGGKLKDLALKNKDAFIMIPQGYPPRCALGYSFIPAIVTLSKIGLVKDKSEEIEKAALFLDRLRKEKLGPAIRGGPNISKDIAKKIYKRFPVVYASNALDSVAIRWRGQFAENSKTLSSAHVFPEMNHNEVVGWVNPRAALDYFTAIMLKDKGDHPRVKRRMEITRAILKKERFRVIEVESLGRTFLERMLSLIYIGDFASFYLSILNGIDPTPVDRIMYLKKQLAK